MSSEIEFGNNSPKKCLLGIDRYRLLMLAYAGIYSIRNRLKN